MYAIFRLFEEVDINHKGYITYWDLYLHRNIYIMKFIIK